MIKPVRPNALLRLPALEDLTGKEGYLVALGNGGVQLASPSVEISGVVLQGAAEGELCEVALAGMPGFAGTVMVKLGSDCTNVGIWLCATNDGDAKSFNDIPPGDTANLRMFARSLETGQEGDLIEAIFLADQSIIEP